MSHEEEFFAKRDREKMEKLRVRLEEEQAQAELQVRQELHWHKCGKCGANMTTVPFRGVEIEICDECGAVLLDNGELETLAGHDQSGMMSAIFSAFSGGD